MEFINGIINKYDSRLIENRGLLEGNIIAGIYNNPQILSEYKIEKTDFITEDGLFYFSLAKELEGLKYSNFDALAIISYLSSNEILKESFENRGGYNTIKELISISNEDNFPSYYDELIKWNIILELYTKGFDIIGNIDKLRKMKSIEIYDFYDYHLNNIFVKKQVTNLKVFDLTIGYDEYFQSCNNGQNLGMSIASGSKILNYHIAGIHKGSVLLHCSHSGKGKSSSAIVLYILPLLEQNEKIVVCANEQSCNDWKNMLIPSIISNKIGHKGFNRQRMQYGNFTNEELNILNKAKMWIEQYYNNLIFIDLSDYSMATFKKIVAKYSRLGYTTWIYDTMKPEDESNERAWGEFTQDSKEMLQVARKYNISLIATAQLSAATSRFNFLDVQCLAKAKAIKEVADVVIMFRNIFRDDRSEKHKFYINPYKYIKDDSGKYLKSREAVELDPNKDYGIFFIDKNRFGKDNIQYLMEKNLDFNYWEDFCYCDVPISF